MRVIKTIKWLYFFAWGILLAPVPANASHPLLYWENNNWDEINWFMEDLDGDDVSDHIDNCIGISNPDQLNTDIDAQGNACDADDDNDGMPDGWESGFGLNPLVNDAGANPDGDLFSNLDEYLYGMNPLFADPERDLLWDEESWDVSVWWRPDADGDGVPDVSDAFPFDASESADADNDGVGNNADWDDDNDGVPDTVDAAPLDSGNTSEITLPLNGIYRGRLIQQNTQP